MINDGKSINIFEFFCGFVELHDGTIKRIDVLLCQNFLQKFSENFKFSREFVVT